MLRCYGLLRNNEGYWGFRGIDISSLKMRFSGWLRFSGIGLVDTNIGFFRGFTLE